MEDAFSAIGNEIRVNILRVLGDAGEALSFSEIRSRVEIRDSGQFNYHLNELRDRYIRQTDSGYILTRAGLRVTSAIEASAYAAGEVVGPESAATDCPICGADRSVVYEDSAVRLHCSANSNHKWLSPLPPGATEERNLDELVELGTTVNRNYGDLAASGTCPECFGQMERWMRSDEEVSERFGGHEYVFQAMCEDCGFPFGGSVGSLVTRHPAVVSAYHKHGVNIRERTILPHEFEPPVVVSEDPLRLRVDVETPRADDDRVLVSLTIDDKADIVNVTENTEI